MKYTLSKTDLVKIGKGFLVAVSGATVVWLGDVSNQVDFGIWTPFVVAGTSVAVNMLRKFMTDTQEK